MKLIILVAVALMGDKPVNFGVFPMESMEACRAEQKKAADAVKEPPVVPGFDIWTRCLEVDRSTLPQKGLPFGPTPRGGKA